jgi:hypothetical protein
MNGIPKKQRGSTKRPQKKAGPPVLIVHVDDGLGRPVCALPQPWPSPGHRMVPAAEMPKPQDVCLTCAWFTKSRMAVT